MINKKTTLILGAGASAHIGYPLGTKLKDNLCNIRIVKKYPPLPNKWTEEDINDFLINLSRASYNSIDAFLEEFSELTEIGKYLITYELKKYENIDDLFSPRNPGWYQTLFLSLINEYDQEIEKNEISIVTFNYDRSLEAYLHHALKHRFKLSEEKAWEHISKLRIVHVHGILGEYPHTKYQKSSDAKELLEISNKIKIIHENKDPQSGFCNDEFELANKLLKDSERIIFLGFGFHEDNIRRFNYFNEKNLNEIEVHTTTSGFSRKEYGQLTSRLEKFGIKSIQDKLHGHGCNEIFKHYLTL